MDRKQFLKSAIGLGCLGLFSNNLMATDYERKMRTKFDIWELVGKDKPKLYGDDFRLRKQAAAAFQAMREEALKVGINIYSQSSYRGFSHQKRIWNGKYIEYISKGHTPQETLNHVMKFSAIPGTSRHHWGTDIDMIDLAPPQPLNRLESKNFEMGGVYEHLAYWLKENAKRFGFIMTYTNNPNRTGFNTEHWQFSYAELSKPILKTFLESDWKSILQDRSISGYNLLTNEFLKIYEEQFILGINPELIPS